ncbi:MAG: hypothetical protein GY749_28035 [Desulfobacteraceae bacterium]|nr:hypothetical protein [Desulfobacteraceae bacterium]
MELAKSAEPGKVYNAIMVNPDWEGPKVPAKWMIDGSPRYKHSSFIAKGLGPKERKDMKWLCPIS